MSAPISFFLLAVLRGKENEEENTKSKGREGGKIKLTETAHHDVPSTFRRREIHYSERLSNPADAASPADVFLIEIGCHSCSNDDIETVFIKYASSPLPLTHFLALSLPAFAKSSFGNYF